MNSQEKTTIITGIIITLLTTIIIVMAVSWPDGAPDGTITYEGWTIYPPSNVTSTWTATHNGKPPLSQNTLPDIYRIITEAQQP